MNLRILLALIAGYLLGSANASLIVGKFYGIDVRKHGSGNAGATNTLRTLGKTAAFLVMVGDILKGVIACIVGALIIGDTSSVAGLGTMVGGIGAILGHNWPLYFGFRGGKGIFTSFAVVLMMDWKIGLILLGIFIVIVALTRYISLGSVVCSALFPVVAYFTGKGMVFILFAFVAAVLAIWRHRANIKRLIAGNESKLGAKKK
jgi:glycerol-3-phosphate acyltransferase PlsY